MSILDKKINETLSGFIIGFIVISLLAASLYQDHMIGEAKRTTIHEATVGRILSTSTDNSAFIGPAITTINTEKGIFVPNLMRHTIWPRSFA